MHKESDNSRFAPHRDFISPSSSLSAITWRNRKKKKTETDWI